MSPDAQIFLQNAVYAAPIVALLYLAGVRWFRYTRFERTVYRRFQTRMADIGNPDPATRNGWVHAVIYGICAVLIVSIHALTKKYLLTILFTVLIILMLGIWDLRSVPERFKLRRAWIKGLAPDDELIIRTYRKMRLEVALIVIVGIAYTYTVLHVDSLY